MKKYIIKFVVDGKPRCSEATEANAAISLYKYAKTLSGSAELYEAHYVQISVDELEEKAAQRARKPKTNGDNNGNGNPTNNGNHNGNGNGNSGNNGNGNKKKQKNK